MFAGLRIITCIGLLGLISSCNQANNEAHNLERSLKDLQVYPGLEVNLFAAEPLLTNPTNIDVDSKGRVWVCEAYNYRSEMNPKNPVHDEGDRILILEDTDGDGKADTRKVYYQGTDINSALGVCVLGNKVIVSCSPHVFIFTDDDGDDVPDSKEILFQGIQGIQHDHGVHSFSFGHDGRLYFTMGNEGKTLLNAKGDTVVDIHGKKIVTDGKPFREGMVMRCNLDGSNVEVVGYNFRNNYEATLDPYGNLWQSDNDDDGNQSTRINFVLDYGNFGFKNALTGADWRKRRTNMEEEIPFRHWHQNDPGVVPNLLLTGSGSPCGITMYEGSMLPEIFQGQLIHAEAGHNVVRSYSLQEEGAGYKASITNLLKGGKDQWFRPVDVSVAPDGSLFIADWYDPGVGGHQVGDLERGRIYRVTKTKKYSVPLFSLQTTNDACKALTSPNNATRFLAWKKIQETGDKAEASLKKLWENSNPRQRAQALWLLSSLSNGEEYIQKSITDSNPDIRITGLRTAKKSGQDIIPLATQLVDDESDQVRREVALALRTENSEQAAQLWARLANQYNGNDRWYLEALGIGADEHWDLYFTTWMKAVGTNWDTPSHRDIIWRSRSKYALPWLRECILKSDEKEMLRYFRSFDFHQDQAKQVELAKVAINSDGEKAMYALKHMDASAIKVTPALHKKINEVLLAYENKIEYVEIIKAFSLKDKTNEILSLALGHPHDIIGQEAARLLVSWNKFDVIDGVLTSANIEKKNSLLRSLQPLMYTDEKVITLMTNVVLDTTQEISIRKVAVSTFGGPTHTEEKLLQLAKENKITEELKLTAVSVFQNTWRTDLRSEASKYLPFPSSKEGQSLPNVNDLINLTGNSTHGKVVFKNMCSTCHQVNNEGTNFGPALSEIGDKLSREAMYKAILFPDQGIGFGYEGYTIELKNGSQLYGMITSETEHEIEITYITNKQTVSKSDIASQTKNPGSLMPSDLQAGMTQQELIDLIEYLMSLKKEI